MIITIVNQIKEWIPYILTGIISCGGTSLALSFLKNKIATAKDKLDSAKTALEEKTDLSTSQIEKLTTTATKLIDSATICIEKYENVINDTNATKEALKLIATNDAKLVGEGVAQQIVEVLDNEKHKD